MKLDIDDNSLYALLQEKREQIGQSWISGAFNIAAAVSLAITGYTTDLHIGMQIFVCIAAVFLTVVGIWQCCISLGKNKYDADMLYEDIEYSDAAEPPFRCGVSHLSGMS